MIPLRLLRKNLFKHKVRLTLTVLSLSIAIFLLCVLQSLVVALDAGVRAAASNRLIVQSKVSLFVYLPTSYGPQLKQIDGVEEVVRWNWFGGYYQEPANFFAQFATDPDRLLAVYPEIEIIEGSPEGWVVDRKSCIVGELTALKFDKRVGDTFPIIGTIFPQLDGSAWEFTIAGIYRSKKKTLDDNTLFFHAEMLEKALESGAASGPSGVGIFVLKIEPGTDPTAIMSQVDALYENGPQVVQATSEAEFQAQFVSMVGNVPMLVSSIGGGVMIAILLAVMNTMFMSAREQTADVGVLKALGFSDASVFGLLLGQSLFLCALGGGLGILAAVASEGSMATLLGTLFPGYEVTSATVLKAIVISIGIGFAAGIAPALRAKSMPVITALRAT